MTVLIVKNVIWEEPGPPDAARRINAVVASIGGLKQHYQKPVVALSGYWPRGFTGRLEAAGADVVLPLPFDCQLFLELVETCLENPTAV